MARKVEQKEDSGKELLEALGVLEREKDISKETMFEAIENSLLTACKQHFGKADNMRVEIDRESGHFKVYATKTVVMKVEDDVLEIAKEDAKKINPDVNSGASDRVIDWIIYGNIPEDIKASLKQIDADNARLRKMSFISLAPADEEVTE